MSVRSSVIIAALALFLGGCITANLSPEPEIFSHQVEPEVVAASMNPKILRMLTINLAHGRGTGLHQALQGKEKAKANLDAVDALIRKENADVVALQEADSPSAWSGGFDHVDYLARAAKYGWGVHTAHAEGAGLAYGTAIISRLPMNGHDAHTFEPARASLPKGFSIATIDWPGAGMVIDVVSVHLEPLRSAIRQRQATEVIAFLRDRNRPLVIMGDLNTEWDHEDGVLQNLVEELELTVFVPEHEDAVTYPRLGRRLDWILISRELEFVKLKILVDEVSDHRAVVAELRKAVQPSGHITRGGDRS